jgi:hypothetical protein
VKKRFLIGALVLATVFATVFGLAATLGVNATELGAGNDTVGSCDSDGVSTSYANSWDATDSQYEVTSVTVDGIADACDGKSLKVALTNSANLKIGDGSVTVPTAAGAFVATVSALTPTPSAAAVTNVHVVIGD